MFSPPICVLFNLAAALQELAPSGDGANELRGMLAEHGGTIDVGSELGRGTTFVIRLPALGSASSTARVGVTKDAARDHLRRDALARRLQQ